jgi:hypothetical protein
MPFERGFLYAAAVATTGGFVAHPTTGRSDRMRMRRRIS